MTRRAVAVRAFDAALTVQWAMQETHLRALFELAARDPGPALEALAARNDKPLENTERTTVRDGVAIVPIMGPLFRYANIFTELSGATSMEMLATDFTRAVDDPRVRAIVLNADTPGGEVNGVSEMASLIMAARGSKPIVAYAAHLCCSGGYWLASAADEVVINTTGIVGSIGAVLTVRDTRALDEARGIKTLEFVSAVSPDKRRDPTSDEGRAKLQAMVDRLGEEFVNAVAAQRGVSVATVLSDFGQGGVLVGADAVKAGMADRVSTLEQVIAKLRSTAPSAGGSVRVVNPDAAAAAAQSEKNRMEIKTTADLEKAYPDLVAAIRTDAATTARAEGHAAGVTEGTQKGKTEGHVAARAEGLEAGKVEGATAERARILAIQSHAVAGAEKIVSEAIADGKTTGDQAAARILANLKAAGPRKIEDLKTEQAPPVGTGSAGGGKDTVAGVDVAKRINAVIAEAAAKGETLSVAAAGARVRKEIAAAG